MSITITTDIFCDSLGCGKFVGVSAKGKCSALARQEARQQGWVRIDGLDLCPHHKPLIVPQHELKAPQ